MAQENKVLSNEELTKKFAVLENAIVVIDKQNKQLTTKNKAFEKTLIAIRDTVEKQELVINEAEKSSTESSTYSSGENLSPEKLNSAVKEVILDDPELLETFQSVFKNVVTFEQNKKDINTQIKQSKMPKKKKVGILSLIAIFIASIIVALFLIFNSSSSYITIPAKTNFSNLENKVFSFDADYRVEAVEKNDFFIFKIKNNTFKVKKESVSLGNN